MKFYDHETILFSIYLHLLTKFQTNLLAPPAFLPYSSAILLQYFENVPQLILSISGCNK